MNLRLVRISKALFWGSLGFTLIMALLPNPPQMLVAASSDKINHMLAFAALTSLHQIAYSGVTFGRRMMLMAALGGLIEIVQLIPGLHRDAQLLDWLADSIAAFTASVIVTLAIRSMAARE